MSSTSFDTRANVGLANTLSNVFKLAEVNGLKWVRYIGPNTPTLEAPKDDPVLNSYAKLLNEGYACAWRRLSPCTDGLSGEAKDLWVFYFTDLPDISDKLTAGLQEEGSGSWDDGMTPESSTMLYRSLHNIIERSLISENFLPLGKWFAKPDSSVATDGSIRGCYLCSFSFFVHAHLFICASVDMRAGPNLQPLLPMHINQALASSTGLQVILSPSGLNGIMTGHSYKMSDPGIDEILEEWKLFYPRRFALDPTPTLPSAIEVVLGGVRIRYPSQFVFVYHGGEEPLPPPPRATLGEGSLDDVIGETWNASNCIDTIQQQKDALGCRCRSSRRPSSQLDLPVKGNSIRHYSNRHEPYSTSGRKVRELATPGSLNLMNMPVLNAKRKPSHFGLPKYGTPLSSPALAPSVSPTPQGKMGVAMSTSSGGVGGFGHMLPTISVNSSTTASTPNAVISHSYSTCVKRYDPGSVSNSHHQPTAIAVAQDTVKSLPLTSTTAMTADTSSLGQGGEQQVYSHQGGVQPEWWDPIRLPESKEALASLLLNLPLRGGGGGSGGNDGGVFRSRSSVGSLSPNTLTTLYSPNSVRKSQIQRPSHLSDQSLNRMAASAALTNSGGTSLGSLLAGNDNATPTTNNHLVMMSTGRGDSVPKTNGEISIESLNRVFDDGLVDSPMSERGEDDQKFVPLKPKTIDVFSDKAVKIEESSLDHIFDSDEDDDGQEEKNFTFGDVMTDDKMDTSTAVTKTTKLTGTDPLPMSIPDLARIYPTPPSVETHSAVDSSKFDDEKMGGEEGVESTMTTATTWINSSFLLDDEMCVPSEFAPLPDLPSFKHTLQQHQIYTKTSAYVGGALSSAHGSSSDNDIQTTSSCKSEPQKFIFPPPSTLSLRPSTNREGLTLPVASRTRYSPHLPSSITSSSPAYSHTRGHVRFPPHLSTPSAITPLDSPFDTITPTPLSATTNRLMPVLPEAHGLYVNIALLDSALFSNVSETHPSISTGSLMSSIGKFITFSSKRIKLDSFADNSSAQDRSGSTTDLLSSMDEKPVMTFGIEDYPSLGFREDVHVSMMSTPDVGNWNAPYGALTKFATAMKMVETMETPGTAGKDTTDTALLNKFLEILQDYCLHTCFAGCHDNSATPHSHASLKEHSQQPHLMLRPPDRSDEIQENSSYRLYHSHSVVSAVLNAKQLVFSSERRIGSGGGTPLINKPVPVTLDKEDNSGGWVLDLLTLPTKFMTKRLKELRSMLQNSFHHAPCLKFTTKGPLTLKDLQQLSPSQTALGDECLPLPMKPVIVGYDHEWLSVSPLTLSAWDKLLFEPFAMRKNIAYLVVATPPSSTHNMTPTLKKFFRDLSLTFKNCNLGEHVPLEKGIGEEGVIISSSGGVAKQEATPTTDDPNTGTRHGAPAGVADIKKFFKKVISSYLSTLPTNSEELFTSHTSTPSHPPDPHPSTNVTTVNQPSPPLTIVLYVPCHLHGGRGREGGAVPEEFYLLHAFSELVNNEEIPSGIREKLVLQLLDYNEILGPSSGKSDQLRSLAFSVYARSQPTFSHLKDVSSLTSFGPTADRNECTKVCSYRQLHAPPFVLSPDAPLSSIGPLVGPQTHPILFDPEEQVLFVGYCVSPDQRWLLVSSCDRVGELIDTSIIGIPHSGGYDIESSRSLSLEKLWSYIASIVSGSLIKWSIVITRFGKPSTSEIKEWPTLIPDDGLLTANQDICANCSSCSHTSSRPHFNNVIVVSVQPERNIQLFPNSDLVPSTSHVMVLPQDPRAAAAAGLCTTPSATDMPQEQQPVDVLDFFGGGGTSSDGDMGLPMDYGIDGGFLSGINFHEEIANSQIGMAPAVEDTSPKATGYLISTSPPGDLPREFWGHERPHSYCSMFKVLLHCHRSEKVPADSPQETLGSTLLCFDALSWLTVDQTTGQRKSCLPIHLFVLSNLHHLFSLFHQERSCHISAAAPPS